MLGGVDVTVAGVNGEQTVVCSRLVKIQPDCSLESVKSQVYDAVIVPGGLKGAETCATVIVLLCFFLNLIWIAFHLYYKNRTRMLET